MINNNGENSPKTKYTNVNKSSYLNIIDNEYNKAFSEKVCFNKIK